MSISACRWIVCSYCGFFFQAEDGIRDLVRSRGLGDVYKRQDVFRSSAPYPQRSFNLMTLSLVGNQGWAASNARFSLRGFPARSDREHSFVEPDVFRIATVIEVKDVPDLTPPVLELNVGDIRVTPTTIEGIQGGGAKLSFKLNNWSFGSTTPWAFSNDLAAIVIPLSLIHISEPTRPY